MITSSVASAARGGTSVIGWLDLHHGTPRAFQRRRSTSASRAFSSLLSTVWSGLVTSYLAGADNASSSSGSGGVHARNTAAAWFRSITTGTASVAPQTGLGVKACALVYEGRALD